MRPRKLCNAMPACMGQCISDTGVFEVKAHQRALLARDDHEIAIQAGCVRELECMNAGAHLMFREGQMSWAAFRG